MCWIRAGGDCVKGEGGGDSRKDLENGWNRKEGSGNKDFKKSWREVGSSRGGCLKKGGWNTMVIVDISTNPPLVCNKLPS